jgi:hypothetical protein
MEQMPKRAVQGVRPRADVDMLFGRLYAYFVTNRDNQASKVLVNSLREHFK